jgi:hypothetical protein
MLRFHTLQSPHRFQVLTFRKGDSVFLAKGTYQGTVGTFLNFRDDPKWADFLSGIHKFAHTLWNGSNIYQARSQPDAETSSRS